MIEVFESNGLTGTAYRPLDINANLKVSHFSIKR